MQIRVGIDSGRRVISRVRAINAPVLVSTNSLWNQDKGRFSNRWTAFRGLDVALDSGGFVAMKLYGRYRWTMDQYAGLVQRMRPTWWAQMDFCCEPEIAGGGEISKRIDATAHHLQSLQTIAARLGIPRPMPVLQGWKPADYCSGPAYDAPFHWPELVGVGSVCRRHLHGRDGLLAVVYALDAALPPHVQLHMFGVKSEAVRLLIQEFPNRIASIDSMAWNMAARWHAFKAGVPQNGEVRAAFMETWYRKQNLIATSSVENTQRRLL